MQDARQFARESGKEKSLQAFNDPKGSFTRDGRYIFSYDYEGKTLALPYQPELIGTGRIDEESHGRFSVAFLCCLAFCYCYSYRGGTRFMLPTASATSAGQMKIRL